MNQLAFFESEALLAMAGSALTAARSSVAPSTLLRDIDEQEADALNDAIVELLADPRLETVVERASGALMPPTTVGLGWRLRTARAEGKPTRMTFFRVKQSSVPVALSMASLSLLLWFPLGPGVAITTLSLGRTLWTNLTTLERPRDATALDAYEALLAARAAERATAKAQGFATPAGPTLAQIQEAAPHVPPHDIIAGLTTLAVKGLVKVVTPAGDVGDHTLPAHRWAPVF